VDRKIGDFVDPMLKNASQSKAVNLKNASVEQRSFQLDDEACVMTIVVIVKAARSANGPSGDLVTDMR
jgi:hypothetical protein